MEKQLRNVIVVDQERCTACGLCIAACPANALILYDGHAALVSERLCDGQGGCMHACTEKALSLVRKIADPYSPPAKEASVAAPLQDAPVQSAHSDKKSARPTPAQKSDSSADAKTALQHAPNAAQPAQPFERHIEAANVEPVTDGYGPCDHWPLKLRLAPVDDQKLLGCHLLIAGDCTAFACPDMNQRVQAGKVTLIGCPKFENAKELTEKLTELLRVVSPLSCTIARMEKPCCKGLVTICSDAVKAAESPIALQETIIYCRGGLGQQEDRK